MWTAPEYRELALRSKKARTLLIRAPRVAVTNSWRKRHKWMTYTKSVEAVAGRVRWVEFADAALLNVAPSSNSLALCYHDG